MINSTLRNLTAAFAAIFCFSLIAAAQTSPSQSFPNVKIKNFGQMDANYYRGAQPKQEDFQSLKDIGVQTVIDLREKPTSYEKAAVEALGMRYINIPMGNGDYPEPEHIEQFLKLASDPATGKFFAHCKGGKHRTGVTGAAYRFTKDGWDYDQAYLEMKNYKFYSSWGYGDMKDFVQDYAEKMKTVKADAMPAAATQVVSSN